MPRDPFDRVVEIFEARDRATTEELGCPLSLRTPDGEVSCERASRARIDLAKLRARTGAVVKAAGPLMLPGRRSARSGEVTIRLSAEELHEFLSAVDQLRDA